MTNGKLSTPGDIALTTSPTADLNQPSSPSSLESRLNALVMALNSFPKPTFTRSQVAVEIKSAFSRYIPIYDDEDGDEEWLESSIENLSFLVVNNCFPSDLTLKGYAKIDVSTSMRGHDQYAMLLVHENRALIEGQAGEREKMAKGLFKSIAMEVGRVIRERKERGDTWVGM
ncbi:hypothetical protein J4E91_004510 [Alternaria rosae]|nr:hypothetical protein J4E91_004510 [Alternaria rosae]